MERATIGRLVGEMTAASVRFDRPIVARSSEGPIGELDALRGVAVSMVLLFHANQAWLPWGWAGVELFFVLSGYLITSIILRNGHSAGFLHRFYMRRGLRTWPIYYLLIGLVVVISLLLATPMFWSGFPYAIVYAQGLPALWPGAGVRFSAYLAHTWTLAVEEQFYLIWPAIVLVVGRRGVPLVAFGCICGSVLARSQGIWNSSLLAHADGLVLGGWLAAWRLARGPKAGADQARWRSGVPFVAAVLFLGLVGAEFGLGAETGRRTHPGLVVLAFNLFWAGVLKLVLSHAGRAEMRWLRFRPLMRIGTISYGLYLYHYPLVVMTHDLSTALAMWTLAPFFRLAAVIFTIPIAVLSWRLVEQPILRWKSRFEYANGSETLPGKPVVVRDRRHVGREV